MQIQTIVVEDEEKSLQVISSLIQQFAGDLELIGSSGNVDKSVKLISNTPPQLIFMDIQIADGTGFDVLRKVESRDFELIFITAHDGYALDAFRASAIDYLLKPVGIPEFEEAVGRARNRIMEKRGHSRVDDLLNEVMKRSSPVKKMAVHTISGFEFIALEDIIWCSSDGSYTTFYLVNEGRIISSKNLGFYEPLLCESDFYRIHNSVIINLQFLKSYIRGKTGYVVLTNGVKLEISLRRKADFLKRF